MTEEQYYALCVVDENGAAEVAFFELGEASAPGALGMSVYPAADGDLQRRHLEDEEVTIAQKSPQELLDAMYEGMPVRVFVNGERFAA